MSARCTRYGCWYSELACARWPITCFIARAYGREAFIRSCALRILDAETISSARVTLRVFCTLLILVLISRPPAIVRLRLPRAGRAELFDALLERRFELVVPVAG